LKLHEGVIKYLDDKTISRGNSRYRKDYDDPETIEEEGNRRAGKIVKYYDFYHSNGKNREAYYWNELKSYHYGIKYQINYDRDYILCNFSIPKYLYGTNVFMLTPYFQSKEYKKFLGMGIIEKFAYSHDLLRKFLNHFNKKYYGGQLYWQFVEISRIDLCYNRVFDNKRYAQDYLIDVKRLRKKYLRENASNWINYQGGIYYTTQDYTFKIYYKGAEFEKHDKRQLLKINKRKNGNHFDIERIQDLADRTIRYEMEFRPGYINKLYKSKLFRNQCGIWTDMYDFYKEVDNKGYFRTDRGKREEWKLDKNEKMAIRYVRKILNNNFYFFMKGGGEFFNSTDKYYDEIFNGKKRITIYRNAVFSRELMTVMANKFTEFIKEFSVNYGNYFDTFWRRIEEQGINSRTLPLIKNYVVNHKKFEKIEKDLDNISTSKVRVFLTLLKDYNWNEIKEQKVFPERTYYRYKTFIESFGLTGVIKFNDVKMKPNNYLKYHTFLLFNFAKLMNLKTYKY